MVAERLKSDECFPGRLFVWGWAPAFYYEAGLRGARPASRFAVLAAAGLTGYVPGNPDGARRREPDEPLLAPAHWDMLMADLDRTPATYILDTAPAGLYRWNRYPLRDYPRLDRYVAEGYDLVEEVSRVRSTGGAAVRRADEACLQTSQIRNASARATRAARASGRTPARRSPV